MLRWDTIKRLRGDLNLNISFLWVYIKWRFLRAVFVETGPELFLNTESLFGLLNLTWEYKLPKTQSFCNWNSCVLDRFAREENFHIAAFLINKFSPKTSYNSILSLYLASCKLLNGIVLVLRLIFPENTRTCLQARTQIKKRLWSAFPACITPDSTYQLINSLLLSYTVCVKAGKA